MKLRLFIVFFCTAASALFLQSLFDQSDHHKAERAVQGYLIGGRALGPFVEARAPGGVWASEITQGCRGIVRVRYVAPNELYEFDYDVPGHTIHPGSEAGRAVLARFAAPPDAGTKD